MEEHFEEFARTIVQEHGKTIEDARGETRRAIENVEVAAGIPTLMQGFGLENVAPRHRRRGRYASPWACSGSSGHSTSRSWCRTGSSPTPSPRATPSSSSRRSRPRSRMTRMAELDHRGGYPCRACFNVIHGAKDAVDALLEHPDVRGISFVGSSPVARYVYSKASAEGKRVQCGGGAKNFLVAMPDAHLDSTIDNMMGSIFGAAGQRCLAGSVVVTVGGSLRGCARPPRRGRAEPEARLRAGRERRHGAGYLPALAGPGARLRRQGRRGRARDLIVDRRSARQDEELAGYFAGPCVFDGVEPQMAIAREEIFGPVAGIMRADSLDEAIGRIEVTAVRQRGQHLHGQRRRGA